MKKISIILACSVCFCFASCTKDSSNEAVQTIKIGGLFSLTGNWSTLGKPSVEAMNIALIDINHYMENKGSNIRFSTVVYDTKLDTAIAKNSIESAFTVNNIKYFIGPQSSAEVGAIRNYANNNNLLVVSQGSTASSLAIPNDAIFRFCPGDVVEGRAISQTMYSSGHHVVITMARDDAGNRGLQQSVGNAITALGGQVDALTPYATNATDYSVILAQLKSKILQYTTTVGADGIGVYLASFDECKDMFIEAAQDPVFSTVNWYGGDGVVLSDVLTSNATAAAFAASTNFFAPNFGLPQQSNPYLSTVVNYIRTNSGMEPDAYALSVYDAMWVIAKTISSYEAVDKDFSKLKTAFTYEANQFYGITGPVVLNNNGDREIGSFDYWGVVEIGGVYQWKLIGKSL